MEEKKKRVRATWTMVRELEGRLADSNKSIGYWVERYKLILDKVDALEKSNRLMEEELDRLRNELEIQRRSNKKHWILWQALKNRGFWARLFNRE